MSAMRPGRETVRELLDRAPKGSAARAERRPAPKPARPRTTAPAAEEPEEDGTEAAAVIALRARLERAAAEIVAEPRFRRFRRARSGFVFDGTARGVGARIELREE